jgi:DNA polymerase III delta subunit
MHLAFIADKSEAYTSFERDRVLKEWAVERADTRVIAQLDEAGIASLFGEPPVSILQFESKEQIKSAVEKLKVASEDAISRYSTPGLIMLTNVERNSTKAIEKLVNELGGEVILSKESGSKESPALKLLNELQLSRDAKEFLTHHAGDDYGSILGLVKTLGALSVKQQQAVTIDDLIVRLPTAPGAVPPWEIEPAILSGNVTKAIELYRRVAQTSSLLVVLFILKNKFKLVFKIASVLEENPRLTASAVAKLLSPAPPAADATKATKDLYEKAATKDNYPLKLAFDTAKRVGVQRSIRILELIATTERKVKSGAGGDPSIQMESLLVQIASLAKR